MCLVCKKRFTGESFAYWRRLVPGVEGPSPSTLGSVEQLTSSQTLTLIDHFSAVQCCAVQCSSGYDLVPGQHSEGSVSLDDAAHHADLLRPEELQGQRLARDQHHGCVRQHRDGLVAVIIVHRATVELLHVRAQVLEEHRGHGGSEKGRCHLWLSQRNTCVMWLVEMRTSSRGFSWGFGLLNFGQILYRNGTFSLVVQLNFFFFIFLWSFVYVFFH